MHNTVTLLLAGCFWLALIVPAPAQDDSDPRSWAR